MKTRKLLVSGIIAIFMALVITACPDSADSSSGSTQTVAKPASSPKGGYYPTTQTVTLTTSTEDAVIYHTLDGTEPTTASTLYSGSISISETTTLKAIAVKDGMNDSDVLTVNYTIKSFPLTYFDDIALYLDTNTGTIDDPIYLPVQIDLGTMTAAGSGWRNLLDIIAQADEFIDIDLSACTMDGTEFNPDANIATGKDKIVSIALPDTATSIANEQGWSGGKYVGTFDNFNVLKLFSAEGLTSIGNVAFVNCTNLALTSLPAGITSIGDGAFWSCTKLALTSLPEGLTSIGNSAFVNCENLALTSLPEGLTSIGHQTFSNCTKLALTSLPAGLTSIGNVAFYNCTKLALVTCLAVTPPTLGLSVFLGTHENLRIEVPAGSVEAYKAATNWSEYADRIFAIEE